MLLYCILSRQSNWGNSQNQSLVTWFYHFSAGVDTSTAPAATSLWTLRWQIPIYCSETKCIQNDCKIQNIKLGPFMSEEIVKYFWHEWDRTYRLCTGEEGLTLTRTERKWCQIENNFVAFRENYVMVDLIEHLIFVKIIPLFVDFRCKMHKQTASHCQYNNAQSLSMNMTWFPVNIRHGVHIEWIYLQKISVAFRRGHLVSCR